MRPAAADHRGDHLDIGQLLELERVAVENDQVGEVSGDELAPAVLVVAEPQA